MRKAMVVVALAMAAALPAACQRGPRGGFRGGYSGEALPQANSEAEKKILGVLDEARRAGELFQNVSTADGRMLRLLAETSGAKHVVELGTSTGLSGLWFCLALQKTGGKLTTFEYDAGRAAAARQHFRQAGVESIVTVVEGDAHQTLSRVKEPIDVVFIDADKDGYVDYLNRLLPLVRPGGLILAHNIDMAPEYRRLVSTNPALDTVYSGEGEGLGITMKKR